MTSTGTTGSGVATIPPTEAHSENLPLPPHWLSVGSVVVVKKALAPGKLTQKDGTALPVPFPHNLDKQLVVTTVTSSAIELGSRSGGDAKGWLPMNLAPEYLRPE